MYEYNIKLTDKDILIIYNALKDMPWEVVNDTIASIIEQKKEQVKFQELTKEC